MDNASEHDPYRLDLDIRGAETAFAPWRHIGDIVEAAAPLAPGPTRYRLRRHVEARYRWREPGHWRGLAGFEGWPPELVREYLTHPVEIDWDGVNEIREKEPEQFAKLLPYLFADRLGADGLERLPGIDWGGLRSWKRVDTTPRPADDIDEWGRLRERVRVPDAPAPEPDVTPWDALTPGAQAAQRLVEYELPRYAVIVPDFDFAEELTPGQEAIAALMAEPPGGENHGRIRDDEGHPVDLSTEGEVRADFLRVGGWRPEHAPLTGNAPGRPGAWPDGVPEDVRASLIAEMGVDPETVAMLYVSGPLSDADRQTKDWVDRRIASAVDARAGVGIRRALADAYGVSESTIKRAARRGRSPSTPA